MSPWGKSQQFRPLREACAAAAITPAISFHILRHTYGSRLARAGVPMQVIAAQLGHADTRITERHYAHLAPDHFAGVVRQSFAPLNIAPASGRCMSNDSGASAPCSWWLDAQLVFVGAQCQGMSSSMRLCGQPLTSRVSRSVR